MRALPDKPAPMCPAEAARKGTGLVARRERWPWIVWFLVGGFVVPVADLAAQESAGPSPESLASADPYVRAAGAFAREDWALAETLLVPLVADPAAPVRAVLLLGDVRVRQQRHADAAQLFARAADADRRNSVARSRLGTALLAQAAAVDAAQKPPLVARALATLAAALAIDPDDYEANLALARYYCDTPAGSGGDYDQALRYAGQLRRIDTFQGCLIEAIAAERYGRLELALERFREAVQIYDADPRLLTGVARVLAKLGRTAEAIAGYEQIVAQYPDFAPARQALAALKAAPTPPPAQAN